MKKTLGLGLMLIVATASAQFGNTNNFFPYVTTLNASDVGLFGRPGTTNYNVAASNAANALLSAANTGGVTVKVPGSSIVTNATDAKLIIQSASGKSALEFRNDVKTNTIYGTGGGGQDFIIDRNGFGGNSGDFEIHQTYIQLRQPLAVDGYLNVTGAVTAASATVGTLSVTGNGTVSGTLSAPSLQFTATLGTDDTFSGETLVGQNAGATVAQWEAVYLNSSSQWVLADANGISTYPAVGLAAAAVTSGNALPVVTAGAIRNDAWNWTPGGVVYLSETAGALTQTAPSSPSKVQAIGIADTADILILKSAADVNASGGGTQAGLTNGSHYVSLDGSGVVNFDGGLNVTANAIQDRAASPRTSFLFGSISYLYSDTVADYAFKWAGGGGGTLNSRVGITFNSVQNNTAASTFTLQASSGRVRCNASPTWITNVFVSTTSHIIATINTEDATAVSVRAIPFAGLIKLVFPAIAGNTDVSFLVLEP